MRVPPDSPAAVRVFRERSPRQRAQCRRLIGGRRGQSRGNGLITAAARRTRASRISQVTPLSAPAGRSGCTYGSRQRDGGGTRQAAGPTL